MSKKKKDTKKKTTLTNILVVIVSIIIGLIISELIFRVAYSGDYLSKKRFIPSEYKDIVYESRPNLKYYSPVHDTIITTNSYGYRDYEFKKEKQKGKIRIICIGDSSTFGFKIKDVENTYPKRLELYLNQKFPDKFEVFNFGIEAYNTHHELGVLKHKALQFSPDIVILGLNFGDTGFDWLTVKSGKISSNSPFEPFIGKILPTGLRDFLMNNSIVFYNLEKLLSITFTSKELQKERVEKALNPNLVEGKGYDLDLIKEFDKICVENNIKLIVAIMPWFNVPVDSKSPEIEKLNALKDDLQANKIDYIDLFKPILYDKKRTKLSSSEYTETLKVAPDDAHPNEEVLKVYANRISKKILKMNIIDSLQ